MRNPKIKTTETTVSTPTTTYEKVNGVWHRNGTRMSFGGQKGKDLLNTLEEKIAAQVAVRKKEEDRKEYDQRDLAAYAKGTASNRAIKRLKKAGLI